MRLSNQSVCRRCVRPMQEVASIQPFGINPGLIAFLCIECGTTDSILVYPMTGSRREAGYTHHREQVEI